MDIAQKMIQEYELSLHSFKSFQLKMENLISSLLESKKIKVHNISARIKEKTSLEKKINSKNKYSNLAEITDIVGLRIITFFEDEVDIIAKLISDEFEIDNLNSIDKRVVEYDKFGYSSLHFVVTLKKPRCKLIEYVEYEKFKFEIQIRSILQHAWAEIEHDIGYKSKSNIPDAVKRNFSRVAALLETSDLEFTKLRNKLTEYEKEIVHEISSNPNDVDLNDISLKSFAKTDKIIDEIDKEISKKSTCLLLKSKDIDTSDIPKLKYLGIKNIDQLSKNLALRRNDIVNFATAFLNPEGSIDRGISLFYLAYVLVAEKKSSEEIQEYVSTFFSRYNENGELTKRIIETYSKIKQK